MNKLQTIDASQLDPSVIPADVITECTRLAHEEERLQRAFEAGRASAFDQVNQSLYSRPRAQFNNAREYERTIAAQLTPVAPLSRAL